MAVLVSCSNHSGRRKQDIVRVVHGSETHDLIGAMQRCQYFGYMLFRCVMTIMKVIGGSHLTLSRVVIVLERQKDSMGVHHGYIFATMQCTHG